MRGSIWSVVALLILTAFVPVVFSENLATNADSVGSEVLGLMSAFSPVLGSVVIVSAAGLFYALFSEDSF